MLFWGTSFDVQSARNLQFQSCFYITCGTMHIDCTCNLQLCALHTIFFFFEHFHSHINVRWVWILTVVSQFFGIRICNDLLKSTDFASRWLERTHFRIGWWLNAFLQWNCHCQNGMAFIILFINEKLTLH